MPAEPTATERRHGDAADRVEPVQGREDEAELDRQIVRAGDDARAVRQDVFIDLRDDERRRLARVLPARHIDDHAPGVARVRQDLGIRLAPGGEEDEIEMLERAGERPLDGDFALTEGHTLPDRTVGGVDIQGANREAALLEDAEEFGSQYPRSADNPDAVCRHNGPLFHFAERHPPPAHRTGYHRYDVRAVGSSENRPTFRSR